MLDCDVVDHADEPNTLCSGVDVPQCEHVTLYGHHHANSCCVVKHLRI